MSNPPARRRRDPRHRGGSSGAEVPEVTALRRRLDEVGLRDELRLGRRLEGLRRITDPARRASALAAVATELEAAAARLTQRRGLLPEVTFPEQLPVSQHRDELAAAIRDSQVVVVAGETGSGKTTQLPKICLELGRGVRGMIGHTQPRRLAARTVAERIAEELGTPLGGVVGYKVRFTDQVGDETMVKLMTDGILLAEIQGDRSLSQYDTLIIDEAHERSLNIDFILGYLKQLLPRRPDLKVVITSATIDPQRFSRHFDDAPVVEVSGRTYPVEVRYRPVVDPDDQESDPDRDQVQAVVDAVDELRGEGPGDILVFLSGEREIRDTAEALRRSAESGSGARGAGAGPAYEVLPLYARLSAAEQHRVFSPHQGRRVVLATNVAETSLTVPGIRYVVDPGTARISRYSHRLKVQRLPIEPISQASANQRKGRCGRVAEGICVRLYSEEDFLSRPEFTEPEILRTNLASVILQMASLGLGDVGAFPFVEPPDRRQVRDGVQLLEELGALDPASKDPKARLTPLGRTLAALPVDPRLARMLVEADRNACLREVLVIAAALSIQDPRERPADKQQAADEKHARFKDKTSDFMSYLALWDYLREQQRELSSSAFRRLCRAEFLNYLRVREWQDLHTQLRQVAKGLGMSANRTPADPDLVHRSLLAGLLSHVGLWDPEKREYVGARGARFSVSPGSALFRRPPRWVMAAELVETTRLWARVAARIEPEWIEAVGGHLLKRTYSEPHWEKDRAAVMAYEKVTLYGLPVVPSRKVGYGRIDPELSRELFLRHALVEGDWRTHHRFFHDNRALLDEVEDLEHRARRRDIVVDDETLFDFYDQRVPAAVVSGRHFDSWWKKTQRSEPDLLDFTASMLVTEAAEKVTEEDYPDTWVQDDLRLPLTYQFEPGSAADGVTVHVPLDVLNQLDGHDLSWNVPGLRHELVTAMIRSLPKHLRRNFVPAPDVARTALETMPVREEPLPEALAAQLRRMTGVTVPPGEWDLGKVPDHLRVTVRVEGDRGRVLGEGKDVGELRARLRPKVREALSAVAETIERAGLVDWPGGVLPRTFERSVGGRTVVGFPALVDEGESVAVRVLGSEAEQRRAMWQGTCRLLLLGLQSPVRGVVGRLDNRSKLALGNNPYASVPALLDDCVACALDSLVAERGGPAWDADGFARLRDAVRAELADRSFEVTVVVARILASAHELDGRLKGIRSLPLLPALTDIRAQLDGLVHLGFVRETGWAQLPDLVRYLQAVARRLDTLADQPQRDRDRLARVELVAREYADLLAALPAGRRDDEEVRAVRWMIEELRVSHFAQSLGTPYRVSEQRILRAIADLRAEG